MPSNSQNSYPSAMVRDCRAGTGSGVYDVQEWLDRPVRAELVAENAIQVEQVEHRLEVPVEQEVIEEDRDVERAARQAQGRRPQGFIARVQSVKKIVATEHAFVDVLCCEIEVVVMVPQ